MHSNELFPSGVIQLLGLTSEDTRDEIHDYLQNLLGMLVSPPIISRCTVHVRLTHRLNMLTSPIKRTRQQ